MIGTLAVFTLRVVIKSVGKLLLMILVAQMFSENICQCLYLNYETCDSFFTYLADIKCNNFFCFMICRRDTIVTRGDAQQKINKKVLTKGTFERQMNEMRKKIKQTVQVGEDFLCT